MGYCYHRKDINPLVGYDQMTQKILLVDDNETLCKALSDWINSLYHDVMVSQVSDGETAIALCCQEDFDLVLMDIGLPGISGLEAIVQIRKIKPAIPLAVMTIQEGNLIEQKAYESGADLYITKRTLYHHLSHVLSEYLK